MRILVISDTHIPVVEKELPQIIREEAKKSDCCLHAGDFITAEVWEELSRLTKVYGVYGNMDNADVCKKFPIKQAIKFDNITVGLIHGRGAPANLVSYIKNQFSQELSSLSVIIYGHSHFADEKKIDGILYCNPGSPTDKLFAPFRSYGILDINKDLVKWRIFKIG
ncbi:MAG: metallophosphoesterase family protein [Candidatus Omnitrophica bacterium]|nr:metallophosphoesterase family protein [Candidatus Omnitrophota bacterium]